MKISGFVKNSFVDYPGRIAAVIFVSGCNFDCYFCHNRAIIQGGAPSVDIPVIMDFLKRRVGLLDGVVISGGEPTIYPDLPEFIAQIKAMGYAVKLDTNGSSPDMLRRLLDAALVDYVAMDVKAPFERYESICHAPANATIESLSLLKSKQVSYELRTTFLPELTSQDIGTIALDIAPVPLYAIQEYRVPDSYPQEMKALVLGARHGKADFEAAARAAAACGGKVVLRI